MPHTREKVYAYITNRDRLLVFNQPDFPEAGTQVPGGTLYPGEDPDAGVLREAIEETGLEGLILAAYLGDALFDNTRYGGDHQHHRRFYHLICPGDPPETWQHWELHPSAGDQKQIRFALRWVPLAAVPPLIAEMDALLPALRSRLAT